MHCVSWQKDAPTSQLGYFCGFDPVCAEGGGPARRAARLARAMENVERNYAVVGVMECMDTTIKVLEAFIPRWAKTSEEYY